MTTRGWRLLAAAGLAAVGAFLVAPGAAAPVSFHVTAVLLLGVLGRHLWRSRSEVDAGWWTAAAAVAVLWLSGLVGDLPDTRVSVDVRTGLLAAGYVLVVLAAGRVIAVRTNLRDLDGIVDTLILCCALGVVLWELLSGPRLAAGPDGARAALVAFPFLQALVVALAVRMMFWSTWRLVGGRLLFLAAVTCSAANVGYVAAELDGHRGTPERWVGALWLVSILCVVLGALHQSAPAVTQVTMPGLSRVPYLRLAVMALSLVATPLVIFGHAADGRVGLVPAVGMLVLIVLVAVRLLRLVAERERARTLLWARSEQQAAVVRLGERALSGSELARLCDEAVAAVAELLLVDHCAVFEPCGTETLAVRAGIGWSSRDGLPTVTTAEPFFGVPLASGSPGLLQPDGLTGRRAPLLERSGVVSGVSVPVGTPAHRFGVLAVASTRPRSFSAADVTFLRAVANVLTAAIERSRTEEQTRQAALYDPVTGLPNHLLLVDRLHGALSRMPRLGGKVAVLVVDVDGFRSVNDAFGHRAGDQLLLAVASRLQKALRMEDTLSRLAGDEFVLVCERIDDLRTISAIAERVVATLAEPFVLDDGTVTVSASIGIAVAASHGDDVHQLVRDADAAMYAAKRGGRARYELAPSEWAAAQHTA